MVQQIREKPHGDTQSRRPATLGRLSHLESVGEEAVLLRTLCLVVDVGQRRRRLGGRSRRHAGRRRRRPLRGDRRRRRRRLRRRVGVGSVDVDGRTVGGSGRPPPQRPGPPPRRPQPAGCRATRMCQISDELQHFRASDSLKKYGRFIEAQHLSTVMLNASVKKYAMS